MGKVSSQEGEAWLGVAAWASDEVWIRLYSSIVVRVKNIKRLRERKGAKVCLRTSSKARISSAGRPRS